uniref:C2H2-type domain-containing protein n=1 Tax=Varanus komodoensis TaxID=61221 RepID=A0A8D2IJS9_VARKO
PLREADLLQAIKQDVEALENGATVAEDVLPTSETAHVCPPSSEALQPLQFSKEQKKVGRDEEEADQEGGDGPSAEEEGSPSERPFQCDVCGRNYKHAGSLINHKQTHKTGLFHCGICHKQFYNLMALKNHNRTHFETKRYRCPECPKAFRLQKQLASHQRVHRDRKREPSSHSSRRFAQAKRAAKAETLSQRPYRCGECGECCIDHSNCTFLVSLENVPLQQHVSFLALEHIWRTEF